eukprot:FR734667.1.p5 GENE.FR734667.1~~FR734667.1.p5  ORF type:complete len:113 (+),score=63.02 FR734667.1:769-1107(+)
METRMRNARFGVKNFKKGEVTKLVPYFAKKKKKKKKKKKRPQWSASQVPSPRGSPSFKTGRPPGGSPPFFSLFGGFICPLVGNLGNTWLPGGKFVSRLPFPTQNTQPKNKKG